MFIFALIYGLFPLLPAVALAMWLGLLFKSYAGDEHGKVREIAARCLGWFLAAPLFALYLAQLGLFTLIGRPGFSFGFALEVEFAISLVLVLIGFGIWLFIRSKGWTVESGKQSSDAFLLKSWRLTAICSVTATSLVLFIPLAFSRLY